jgi:malonate-semialdehyde dehydrogenase (acetylating)/methylmalonate-semialdehyde dehydrogenase
VNFLPVNFSQVEHVDVAFMLCLRSNRNIDFRSKYRIGVSPVEHVSHRVGDGLGSWSGDRTGKVFNPATGEVTAQVAFASEDDVDRTVGVAQEAFRDWSRTSLAKRADILFRFRSLVAARRQELADVITAEHGKVLADAAGEVSRGLEVVDLACGAPSLLKGGFSNGVSGGVDVHSIRQPLGVTGIISPFNFPAMVPMWFFPIAIAAGNTVVLKPSEKTPSAANLLADLWTEAGLPPGVFNVVHGDKTAVGALLRNETVQSVSFVGSTPVARHIYTEAAASGKRVQALGGAKNHMIVLPDADLDAAADAAISAAFGSAGERCMAISVLVAVEPVADDLTARITERTATLRVGDGRRGTDMGPLVTAGHRDRVASYLDAGTAAGAQLVIDGRDVTPDGEPGGFWLGPSLLDHVTTDMSVYRDEIFGPVLSVVRAKSYDEALAIVNASEYGNGTAIFTSDGGAARRFESEVQVGLIGVNVPIPVPVAYYSFGGWKKSLFGDTHAYGPDGFHFFTRGKVVTSRWSTRQDLDLHFPQNG